MCQRLIRKQRTSKQDGMVGLTWCLAIRRGRESKLQEKEWFAERNPEIVKARTGAERKRLIAKLRNENPDLYSAFSAELRQHDGVGHFIGNSEHFPLCGRGRINLYAVFAEEMRNLLSPRGRVGNVLPTGIVTDDNTKYFFQGLVKTESLVRIYSFENEEFIFPNVHHATKFCLCTAGGGWTSISKTADFIFFARQVEDLSDSERHFTLSKEDISQLNPNTQTCPAFRSARDAELNKAVYRRFSVLVREEQNGKGEENPWNVTFKQGLFNMTSDSHLFRTSEQLEAEGWWREGNVFRLHEGLRLPLYEAKMIHHYDHRWGTYEGQTEAQANQGKLPELSEDGHRDPCRVVMPRYWVPETEVDKSLGERRKDQWLVGWRDICRSVDSRTAISAIMPKVGISGGQSSPQRFIQGKGSPTLLSADLSDIRDFDYLCRARYLEHISALCLMRQIAGAIAE